MDTRAALLEELGRELDSPGVAVSAYIGNRDHIRLLARNGVATTRLAAYGDILLRYAALRDARVTLPPEAPADPLARIREQERARDARRRARLRGEDMPRRRPGTRRADQDREIVASFPAAAAS